MSQRSKSMKSIRKPSSSVSRNNASIMATKAVLKLMKEHKNSGQPLDYNILDKKRIPEKLGLFIQLGIIQIIDHNSEPLIYVLKKGAKPFSSIENYDQVQGGLLGALWVAKHRMGDNQTAAGRRTKKRKQKYKRRRKTKSKKRRLRKRSNKKRGSGIDLTI
jgi:hypothetical protein